MDYDTQRNLMERLVKNSEKQLFYSRIAAFAALAAAAALGICLAMMMPSVMRIVDRANEVMAQASVTIHLADDAIRSVTDMSNAMKDMGTNMDTLISENAESIEDSPPPSLFLLDFPADIRFSHMTFSGQWHVNG